MAASKPLCIIPARGNSKRFPRKNLAMLKGIPLIAHTINAAKESGVFGAIIVSSEDEEILDVAKKYGVEGALRPEELSGDRVPIADVCLHVLKEYTGNDASEIFAMLQPTSPLRTGGDICAAYDLLMTNATEAVISVATLSHAPQRAQIIEHGLLKPFFKAADVEKQSQDLPPLYVPNGAVNVMKTAVFLRETTFFVAKAAPYILPPERAVDIDEPLDLEWAEFLLSR